MHHNLLRLNIRTDKNQLCNVPFDGFCRLVRPFFTFPVSLAISRASRALFWISSGTLEFYISRCHNSPLSGAAPLLLHHHSSVACFRSNVLYYVNKRSDKGLSLSRRMENTATPPSSPRPVQRDTFIGGSQGDLIDLNSIRIVDDLSAPMGRETL